MDVLRTESLSSRFSSYLFNPVVIGSEQIRWKRRAAKRRCEAHVI